MLELDFRAVKFLFFPWRDLNSHHWYTAAPYISVVFHKNEQSTFNIYQNLCCLHWYSLSVIGIGHDINRAHCGNITRDNNMIGILNCPLTNAFESPGRFQCLRARLEWKLYRSMDNTTGICYFTIKHTTLSYKGRICLSWNCPSATSGCGLLLLWSSIIQIHSSFSSSKRNLFVPWCSLTISCVDYLNVMYVLLYYLYYYYYQNSGFPPSCIGELCRMWLSCINPLVFLLLTHLNYSPFQSFDFERTWCRLLQKGVVRTTKLWYLRFYFCYFSYVFSCILISIITHKTWTID